MSARVWVRGRVRVRASGMLRAPKVVGCIRSGDHVVRVVVLRAAVLQWDLSRLSLGLTYSYKYRVLHSLA